VHHAEDERPIIGDLGLARCNDAFVPTATRPSAASARTQKQARSAFAAATPDPPVSRNDPEFCTPRRRECGIFAQWGAGTVDRSSAPTPFSSPSHRSDQPPGRRAMATAKKAAKKPAKKPAAKKPAAKKPAAKKAPAKKAAPKKAAPKKAAKKPAAKRKPNAAFMKAMTPSGALAAVVGAMPIPRTEVTKKIWDYIKKNKLQDAINRRLINADEKLKQVFGGKKQVSMFEMTKLVSNHLK
jgi:upstream activation factor subunit UAF30